MAARLTAFLVAAIVGVTLVAGLIVGAQREDDSGPIDLLIFNGRVYTGRADEPFAEAVAVRGNRIYRVGSNRDIKHLRRRATTVIDAHGGSVLAGFTDTHASLPIPTRPQAVDAGAVASPSPALAGAAATGAAPGDLGAAALREAVEGAHRLGLTAIGVTLDSPDALDEYMRLHAAGDLPLRIVAAVRVPATVAESTLARIEALRLSPDAGPMVRMDAVALDVTVPPATTAAADPEVGRPAGASGGAAGPAALEEELVQALDRRGLPLVLRVGDPRELSAALDALERAARAHPAPAVRRRHRLALAYPMALDLDRVRALGTTISLPLPATWPADRALADRAAAAVALDAGAEGARLDVSARPAGPLDGVRLVMASETLADPRLGLQALITSTAPAAAAVTPLPEAAGPVDGDLLQAAIRALTADAAAAQGDDSLRGTVAKDMLADLIVLSADLFTLAPDKLLDAIVTLTILDGKIVFDRDAESAAATEQ